MDSQHPGSSKPMISLLNLLLSGVICMCRASLTKHVQQWLRPSHHDVLSLSAQAKNKKHQQHHPIKWEEVKVVDSASKNRELKIKEALHIQMTPDNNKFNRGIGLERPGCWLSMLHVNHPSGCTLQKSCRLHCVVIPQRRVQPQLNPEEDFGKKSKRRVRL